MVAALKAIGVRRINVVSGYQVLGPLTGVVALVGADNVGVQGSDIGG